MTKPILRAIRLSILCSVVGGSREKILSEYLYPCACSSHYQWLSLSCRKIGTIKCRLALRAPCCCVCQGRGNKLGWWNGGDTIVGFKLICKVDGHPTTTFTLFIEQTRDPYQSGYRAFQESVGKFFRGEWWKMGMVGYKEYHKRGANCGSSCAHSPLNAHTLVK